MEQRRAALVRMAIGRLAGRLSPWLDDALLIGQGLVTLLEFAEGAPDLELRDEEAVERLVGGMRAWARESSWFRAAWPCRIAPLCSSLADRTAGLKSDPQIAEDLGLDSQRLAERYAEAGLVFAVSPELLVSRVRPLDLAGAICRLPLEQRQLLSLYFEDGLSFPEIADLLAVTPGEAQAIYGRAAASIRAGVFGARRPTGAGW